MPDATTTDAASPDKSDQDDLKIQIRSLRDGLAGSSRDLGRLQDILARISVIEGMMQRGNVPPEMASAVAGIRAEVEQQTQQLETEKARTGSVTESLAAVVSQGIVINQMSQSSQHYYSQSLVQGQSYSTVSLTPEMLQQQSLEQVQLAQALDGSAFREYFSRIGFHSLGSSQQSGIRIEITGIDKLTEAQRLGHWKADSKGLHEALTRFQDKKTFEILFNDKMPLPERWALVNQHSETFQRAHEQIDRITSLYENAHNAPPAMQPALRQLLEKEQDELRSLLKTKIIQEILLGDSAAHHAVYGGVTVAAPASGLATQAGDRSGAVTPTP